LVFGKRYFKWVLDWGFGEGRLDNRKSEVVEIE
jgi:hypothetical protein